MKSQLIRNYLILILLGITAPGWSQGREYIYDHFNISNGLISDNVFKIFLDSDGHAWMITYNGLQKYNGYEFRTYTSHASKPGTLSSNFVEDIFEDQAGDLIVVLEDGIDIYDKKSDLFRNLIRDLPFAELRRNEISRQASAVQDRSKTIWVNCNNQLVRIDSAKRDFIVYEDDYRGRFVLNKDSTALMITTDRTLKKYDLVRRILTIRNLEDVLSPTRIRRLNTLYYDSKDVCWVGTSDGLFIYDEGHGSFIDPTSGFLQANGNQKRLFKEEITAIYEDYKEDIWVASGSTLQRIDRNTGRVEILQHELDNPNSILAEQITGIHGNHSGIIWLTYLNEGITRINIRTQNFRSYRFGSDQHNGLGGNTVRSIFKDESGRIWVGLYNDGLDRIDTYSGKITHFKHVPEDGRSICSNYISSLFLDSRERLWVGSHDNGLCVADRAGSDKLTFKKTDFLNLNEEIYHILGDSLGRIWIGTRNGLGMYDYGSGQFQWILENHNVQSFIFDKETIWISSWDYGLCRLNFSPEEFASMDPAYDTISSIIGYPNELPRPQLNSSGHLEAGSLRNCISIYQDHQSTIWVGTYDMGLAKAQPVPGGMRYAIYDATVGAPGNAIYGVSGDEMGNIWVSTVKGLGKFIPATGQFENYFREDGLLSDYFMWKSYFKATDGELYFGSVDGLTLFYPGEIESDTSSPKVLISEFWIQGRIVEIGDTINDEVVLQRHISYLDHLNLNHRNSQNFSFYFYAAGHVNHHRIRYSYMLEGYDKEWMLDSRGNRMATYSNLSPGTYRFRVRATENVLRWDGSYKEIQLTIEPPWWKTKVAYVVYLVFILGLVFVISHSLIRFLGLKHELLYKEKLHQSKLMFFTNISHELKTPLSLIKAPLNDIVNENDLSPRNRKNLQIARHNADNLLNLVNELLEFRRTDVGISKLRAEKIELMGFVREMVEEFECVSEQKKVNFYFDIPDEQLQIWVDTKKFRKIINNLFENALNYTSEDGLIILSIIRNPKDFKFNPNYNTLQLNNVNKHLEYIGILVSDTGVGISKESLPNIFDRFYQIEAERANHHIGSGIGLALVKNLVLIHQGEIRVGSQRAVGTDILVMLPLGDKHLSREEKLIPQTGLSGENLAIGENIQIEVTPESLSDSDENGSKLPKILIVEDHKDLRLYLKEQLSGEFHVMTVSDGGAALQQIRQSRPDLVITDWIMPGMDGEALIRELRKDSHMAAIPVILLTAKGELHDQRAGLELGADLVIPKPFNIQLLILQARRIIENNRTRIREYGGYTPENIEDVKNSHNAAFIELLEKTILHNIWDISLNAAVIAKKLGVSRTILYEKLKSVTGETVGEFIQKVRLQQAIRLMLYENSPLSEIHILVGFSSTSYFFRLFKKYYHTTPREYIHAFLKTSSN